MPACRPPGRSSQSANSIFDCPALPASLASAALNNRAGGRLMNFVPPEADFQRDSQARQRFTSTDPLVLTTARHQRVNRRSWPACAYRQLGKPAAGFSSFGGILGMPNNQTLSARVFFHHDVKAMSQFPVENAGYAAHYGQRALRRWEALNSLQTGVLNR